MNGSAPRRGPGTPPGVIGLGRRAVSGAFDTAASIPIAGEFLMAGRDATQRIVETSAAAVVATTRTALSATIRQVVDILTTDIDLTALVVDNVDLDRVIAAVDVGSILDRLDLDEIVRRVDLDAAVSRVDLNAIIDRLDIDHVLARVDIMSVIGRVDLDDVVARVDLDRAVTRVDVQAVIRQVDLIGLANEIIDGVDLTGIIREASTSVTADVMTDVRSTGERADDAVAHIVGRILRRAPEPDRDE